MLSLINYRELSIEDSFIVSLEAINELSILSIEHPYEIVFAATH
jgi:hypothetical protein